MKLYFTIKKKEVDPMPYADFMAFLFPHKELIEKRGNIEISQNLVLDFCHVTCVPPYKRKIKDILIEYTWFRGILEKQNKMPILKYFFGLQNPPENVNYSELLVLKGMGINFMTLAYEEINEYGGGFTAPNEPLTEKGKQLLEMMAETEMILDLSHAGHRTAREAINFISKRKLNVRVVATHTACFSIYPYGRCLPNDVLIGIRDLDGLVGLVTTSWILHENDNSFQPFIDHLDYLIKLIGEKNVCLGTDSVYRYINSIESRECFDIMKNTLNSRSSFRARLPEQAIELNRPDKLLIIEKKLQSLGWPVMKIKRIMGDNLISFFSEL